jgi:O-antigen ligase
MNTILLVFFIIAFYQLYTVIIPDNEHNRFASLLDYRFASAFGNKNIFSQCLLFTLPFIALSISSFKMYWKGLAVFNFASMVILICLMQTLSVIMAFAVSIIFIGTIIIYIGFKTRKPVKRIILFGVLSTTLCFAFLLMAKPAENKNPLLKKAQLAFTYLISKDTTTFAENSNSVHERLILWKNSLQMIKEHPFSGVGFTNWKLFFPKYGYSGAPYLDTDTTKFIKAHNDYLEIWSEAGIVTVLAFILLFFEGGHFTLLKLF